MRDKLLNFVRGFLGTKRLLMDMKKLKVQDSFRHYETRRYQLIEHILHDQESGVSSERYVDHDIIVSLTTFGKRIHDVAFTIESIMQQSVKANRIILWLDYSFQNQRLPQSLLNQQKRGLEIDFCDDIRSYKKLIPTMKKYPNDAIITVDDDLLYDYDLLEHLICSYMGNPLGIHACRMREISFDKKGDLLPYRNWDLLNNETWEDKPRFLTSGGGTLFPPHCFDDEVFNEDVFMDICKYADDVWVNAMAIKDGKKLIKAYTRNVQGEDYLINVGVQDVGLLNINTLGEMLNDTQIKAVFTRYSLYNRLR